jgi:H+/gluconate symporter-like permease
MEVLGIWLSLACLMFVAYKGYSVIVFAPIFALIAAVMQGLPLMPAYTELFMGNAVTYVKSFFPVFLLGAVFGKVMEDTGLAKSIAHWIVEKVGHKNAILAVILACYVMTYGGISLFVVVFAIYPFAANLFKEADIPKRLIPGAIAAGSFTITMTAIPGTPQIQNIIPTNFYGTNAYAAPWTGMIAAVGIFIITVLWFNYRLKVARARGEGYGHHTLNEPEKIDVTNLPSPLLSLVPLILVVVVNYIVTFSVNFDPKQFETLVKILGKTPPLMAPGVKNVLGNWSLIIALVIGTASAIVIGYKSMPKNVTIAKAINAGAIGSLLAIMNTASEVGYGNVIASLPGFKIIADFLLNVKVGNSPLVSEAMTVNILAGITGSASGGMSIALGAMAKPWLEWANQVGLDPQMLHRIASLACGGLDSLPHNGAVITLLAVCGMTHKESYIDIGMITVVATVAMSFVMIAFHAITGLV